MKEIKESTTVSKYQAIDGTVFNLKSECESYEESVNCTLLYMYNKLKIKTSVTEYDIIPDFSNDGNYDIIKMQDVDEYELVLKLYCSINKVYRTDCPEYHTKAMDRITDCYNCQQHLIIHRGSEYDNYLVFQPFTTLEVMIEHLKELKFKIDNPIIEENNKIK